MRSLSIGLIYALFALTSALESIVPPLLPAFKHDFGLSTVEASALLSMPWFVMFVLAIPIGAVTDLFGPRLVTLIGGALVFSAALVQGFSSEFWSLLAGRAIFGAGLGIMWTAGIAWVAGALAGDAGAVGGTSAAGGFGLIVGPILGANLAEHGSLTTPFLVYGSAVALVTLSLAGLSPTARRQHREPPLEKDRDLLLETLRVAMRERRILGAIVLVIVMGLASGVTNLLVPLGLDKNGLSAGEIGAAFSAMSALFLFVCILTARAGDRLVSVWMAGIALLLSAGVSLLPIVSQQSVVLVSFLLLTAPFSRAPLATITYPLAIKGSRRAGLRIGAVLGLVNVCWSLSATLGPLAGGALAQRAGAQGAFFAVSCTLALAGVWMYTTDRPR